MVLPQNCKRLHYPLEAAWFVSKGVMGLGISAVKTDVELLDCLFLMLLSTASDKCHPFVESFTPTPNAVAKSKQAGSTGSSVGSPPVIVNRLMPHRQRYSISPIFCSSDSSPESLRPESL